MRCRSPGDGWLMRAGYTMVWFGWEMDVRPGMSRIGMPPIVARNHDGSAITGIVRSEIITPVPATSVPISLSQQIQNYPIDSYDSYPTASLDNSAPFPDGFLPTLTVRAREQDPREPIPNSAWSFGDMRAGRGLDAGREARLLSRRLQTGTSLRIDLSRQGSDRRRARICRRA